MNRPLAARENISRSMTYGHAVVLAIASVVPWFLPGIAAAQWPQFGGPNRNFTSAATGLATTWPKDGPKRLWSRPLGEGFSGISAMDGRLYTMHRDGSQEVVVAIGADDGKTVWEHRYEADLYGKLDRNYGTGPRATPLVVGDHLYTIGITAIFHCLDRGTGKVIWSHDLIKEYDATKVMWGYSSSPLLYNDAIILPVGGRGHAVMAFDKDDGAVVWSTQDSPNAYSSAILIDVDGRDEVVVLTAREIMGLNPETGELHWRHKHRTSWDVNASTPVWGDDNILFVSTAYNTGAVALKLALEDDKITATELWRQRKIQTHFGDAIRIGDHIYCSSGGNGPVFFAAVDVQTGEIVFRERGAVAKAQLVYADDKLILLDEDGHLAIATVTPEGITVHARAKILDKVSWTAPTLVDRVLYVRDRKTIMAVDLG